ncbi:MAG TPA: glycosyl hydrolase family 65 protein [Armatimonadota bacterium]
MQNRRIAPSREYALTVLRNPSGLSMELLPDGSLFAIRCGGTLVSQVLPVPPDSALARVYVRDGTDPSASLALLGPALPGGPPAAPVLEDVAEGHARWALSRGPWESSLTLQLHPVLPSWVWRVALRNRTDETRTATVLFGQDLGLASEGAVRSNEAYCSQYIDHLAVPDPDWGTVLLSRQNQPQDGKHPWIAHACLSGSRSWSTDGYQFLGRDHRLTGIVRALEQGSLDSRILQYEMAYPALQSRDLTVEPGASAYVVFGVVFQEDHPAASSEADLPAIRVAMPHWAEPDPGAAPPLSSRPDTVLGCQWLHGDELSDADWATLYPGEALHLERDGEGRRLSFFLADGRHVVSRAKEALVERPHGHILRTGTTLSLDPEVLGVTVGMAGLFASQVYLGNTNLARFLSVQRNPLGLLRGSGQRVFVRRGDAWRQLGVPSAFEMGPTHARWLYAQGGDLLEAEVTASEAAPALALVLRVLKGSPRSFLVSHQLAVGEAEMAEPVHLALDRAAGTATCRADPSSLLGKQWPGVSFTVSCPPGGLVALGGDELLYADRVSRGGPYLCVESRPIAELRLAISGACELKPSSDECGGHDWRAGLPRLEHPAPSVGRLDAVLPWFAHDAWIHFTAPHGLEQYGGAAWGTRDVCQGPVEWLLSTGRPGAARALLLRVFEQQYEASGGWPQWFMHEPFRFIQASDSHGDVPFWPVKALCDYVEAANDPGLLLEEVPYTDPQGYVSTSHRVSLLGHIGHVLRHYEERCLPDTALVSYGEGDWDDTLQPADPELRSSMVSAWTVGLTYDVFRRLRAACQHAGQEELSAWLGEALSRIASDFRRLLMVDGVTAGFAVLGDEGPRLLLHPRDEVTGIRYRLLPMTRGVLSELFTPEEAQAHMELVRRHLLCPDGVRLMSDPVEYRGGVSRWFRRAETAANFGREIGLMYSHAHLRCAEALAKLGDGEGLWSALQQVNPIQLRDVVPRAEPRQSNVYFSSSDGAFSDRYEAARRFGELRDGTVPVKGGWRLYSSGPGLFTNKVITCLLGLRDSYGDLVIDPVLPPSLDGLEAELQWHGRPLRVRYRVHSRTYGPSSLMLNGESLPCERRDENPYRAGGVRLDAREVLGRLRPDANVLEVAL